MAEFKISLRAARVNADMTIDEVAHIMHRGAQTIRNWETGKTSVPGVDLKRLCSLYKCPVECVFLPDELS